VGCNANILVSEYGQSVCSYYFDAANRALPRNTFSDLTLYNIGGAIWLRARSAQRGSACGRHSGTGSRESDHPPVGAREQHVHLQRRRGHRAKLRVLMDYCDDFLNRGYKS